jgi:nicotinate phosphoribosyltransferase
MLDNAGFTDAKIIVSNSLDEYTITSILQQGGQVSSFGVGERLITAKSEPVFGAVYKLCAVTDAKTGETIPKIKISENVEKITNPGKKKAYRVYSQKTGYAIADLLTLEDEQPDFSESYAFVDPKQPWKNMKFRNVDAKPLKVKIFDNGELVYEKPTLKEIQAFVKKQLASEIWEEEQRFYNPHTHYLDMTPDYYRMKNKELEENSK